MIKISSSGMLMTPTYFTEKFIEYDCEESS